MTRHVKDPDAVNDWLFPWTSQGWMPDGDSIASYEVFSDDFTVDSHSESDGDVTVWLSGGTVGRYNRVTCRIVTSQGRTDDRTLAIWVTER